MCYTVRRGFQGRQGEALLHLSTEITVPSIPGGLDFALSKTHTVYFPPKCK